MAPKNHPASTLTSRILAALAFSALATVTGAGCSGGNTPVDGGADAAPADAATDGNTDGAPADTAPPVLHDPADCDPLDEAECALPWPSNLYLTADTTTRTGVALRFARTALPDNSNNRTIDPAPYNRMDGYGVGTPIMTVFPNLDPAQLPDENHVEQSMAMDAPILLFAVHGTTLTRVPYYAELDSQEPDAARRVLFVRPAVILEEATRYVVAFRNLRATGGAAIAPSAAFTALRDGTASSNPRLAPRQARFNEVFTLLEGQGVMRNTLTLAWDFVTASDDVLHSRLLFMRDDALMATGATGPALTVTTVTQYARTSDGSGREVNANIAFEIEGTYTVPSYMRPLTRGFTGEQFNYDAMGRPARNGEHTAQFWVRIPWSALDGTPHRLCEYGHGLLGSGTEVRAGYLGQMANDLHLIFFAADLSGMSAADAALVTGLLNDLSYFAWIGDRLHQGITEYVLLARAMRRRLQGVLSARTEPMLARVVVDDAEIYYSGNSQGGIFGGTVVAVSPDIERGHLGVPGNNYTTLLHRSTDFNNFFSILRGTYPRTSNQAVALATIALSWESTEPVSYFRHLSAAPFPGNNPHYVLLTPAKGDHQVAVMTNEVLARSSLGVALMEHYDNQRTVPLVTEQPYGATGFMGSGVVLYDFGNPWPAPGNHVPMDSMEDPHELVRRSPEEQRQVGQFFRNHVIVDTCGGDGCHPN